MELALLAFCFVVALIIACLLILGVLWISDKRYQARIRGRKELRRSFERTYGVSSSTNDLPESDWQFPERWSPTKGETHLHKTRIGLDGKETT